MPGVAGVSAGSLLGVAMTDASFPVGNVSFLQLSPMSFEEFLLAIDDERSYDRLCSINYPDTIPGVIHQRLMDRLREYFIVGGLPEVVETYRENRDNKVEAFLMVRAKQEELLNTYRSDFAKYSGKIRAREISMVFDSLAPQLARENKKFKASEAIPQGRFARLIYPIDWLEGAGLVSKVKIINSAEIPFSVFASKTRMKLYLFDIGILGALAGIPPRSIHMEADLFSTYKGAFCENFVAQEFKYSDSGQLYSWMRNTAEVEFVREVEGRVYPIEVKAGQSGKLKSLKIFADRYPVRYRTRISARNLEFNHQAKIHSYPLYLSYRFPLIL
ncbi:MAG: DUF4143 domain-containing protein [bacterium]|nr:DUF4143 domain-containing protein [bacterium]